jgi:hypothetical protein
MLRRDVFHILPALLAGGARAVPAGAEYEAAIAEWRKNYDRDLKSDTGPCTLSDGTTYPKAKLKSAVTHRAAFHSRIALRSGPALSSVEAIP